ncbi:MAG: hypothetical protein PHH54_00220 [Candidatus Nanoarchaeia archaeon]|nr:hypothetical protein [Candidatus Nanoarchaeia archaeon]MDD5740387.1 hypothetical protein [Candidatus Nanoarchaeia archaeon]
MENKNRKDDKITGFLLGVLILSPIHYRQYQKQIDLERVPVAIKKDVNKDELDDLILHRKNNEIIVLYQNNKGEYHLRKNK